MKNYLLLILVIVCLFFVSVNLFRGTKRVDTPFPTPQQQEQFEEREETPVFEEEVTTPISEETDQFGRYIEDGCKTVSTCNGPITCVNEDFDTSNIGGNCAIRPEQACYRDSDARCEKQSSGQCGWTPTEELSLCLENPPSVN